MNSVWLDHRWYEYGWASNCGVSNEFWSVQSWHKAMLLN